MLSGVTLRLHGANGAKKVKKLGINNLHNFFICLANRVGQFFIFLLEKWTKK